MITTKITITLEHPKAPLPPNFNWGQMIVWLFKRTPFILKQVQIHVGSGSTIEPEKKEVDEPKES